MAHTVELHDSFATSIGLLSQGVQDEMGVIVSALEADPYFEPDPSEYFFKRHVEQHSCSCRHMSHWGDWQLLWLYEYSHRFSSMISNIVVALIEEPVEVKPILPRTESQ
jgi:hypothetical protein